MKKLILITGSSGFVGLNLTDYLQKKGYSVNGISRAAKNENEITYNSLNQQVWDTSYAMVHAAGKAHDLKKTAAESEYFEINTELTKKLFDAFLKSQTKVFIYISSVKAAADKVENILEEDDLPTPVTAYGKSKLEAEHYIQSKEIPYGKRVYILRPCMIHGPNNKGNLNLLYSFVAKGIPYPLGNYKNERSFVSIENLCFVINELIENNIASGVYNVADDEALSTNILVQIIGEVIGKSAKIWNVPEIIINFIAKLGDILPLPISSERLDKLTENYRVSNKKLKLALGKELPINAKQGLKSTIKSFQ
jgi:nucleoside-diphosphate-sugar epimerase